jgi:hypothetical protein
VLILSEAGDTLRRFKTELDSCFGAISWGLETRGVSFPSNREPDKDQLEPGGGPLVLPGRYKVVVLYGENRDSTVLTVIDDPRLDIPRAERQAKADALRLYYPLVERANKAYERLKEAEKTIKLVEDQFVNVPDSVKKEVLKLGKTLRDSIGVLKEVFFEQKEAKGIQRNPNALNNDLRRAVNYINESRGEPNATAQIAIKAAQEKTEKVLERINVLLDKPWSEFRTKAESIQASLFKDWEKL